MPAVSTLGAHLVNIPTRVSNVILWQKNCTNGFENILNPKSHAQCIMNFVAISCNAWMNNIEISRYAVSLITAHLLEILKLFLKFKNVSLRHCLKLSWKMCMTFLVKYNQCRIIVQHWYSINQKFYFPLAIHIQPSAAITQSNKTLHCIQHHSDWDKT